MTASIVLWWWAAILSLITPSQSFIYCRASSATLQSPTWEAQISPGNWREIKTREARLRLVNACLMDQEATSFYWGIWVWVDVFFFSFYAILSSNKKTREHLVTNKRVTRLLHIHTLTQVWGLIQHAVIAAIYYPWSFSHRSAPYISTCLFHCFTPVSAIHLHSLFLDRHLLQDIASDWNISHSNSTISATSHITSGCEVCATL